jgi:two-component system nitrogen regulation sensor histidine kinase NtrY
LNASPPPSALQPAPATPAEGNAPAEGAAPADGRAGRGRSLLVRIVDTLMGKVVTIGLAVVALALGISTFIVLARGSPFGLAPGVGVGMVLANLSVLLVLGALLAGRLTRVWMERRRGSAGARLHVRLVLLFGGVAVAPTIVVATFAVTFFHLGIQTWFNDPVREALQQSLQASRGYLAEHRNNIRSVALEMANDLARAGRFLTIDPSAFAEVLATQTALRGLTEAIIYEPVTGQVMASAGLFAGAGTEAPPDWATNRARAGDVVVLDADDGTRVRAVVRLQSTPDMMLLVGRPVDPQILDHMARTELAVEAYQRMDENRSWLQLAFAWIFAILALLVLCAAVLVGLVLANQIARPIGRLIQAAERVRGGDLGVRVPEAAPHDEIAGLSRAFNRMTNQLAAQRTELMDAYGQIDERRRFTETVLSGVSAGVVGLDAQGRIELPNRAASDLLGTDLWTVLGQELPAVAPEFAALLREAREAPERPRMGEIQLGPPTHRRTLLVRIGAELKGGRTDGYVVTFDDITELQSAQRKAAWADVARRIAHEIKNPLTPIQLSAERLKRKFAKEIISDPETFAQCADTIVRHVGDIGRMVDEFSRFARMPTPQMRPEDIGRLAREVFVLRRTARPDLDWCSDIPERGPVVRCDARLLREALTNLLQNAEDAVASAAAQGARQVCLTVEVSGGMARLRVTDDGIGLPEQDREKLTEPYVTHKPKGTGLGLAIVKKIMEDHGGTVALDDRPDGRGAMAVLSLPATDAAMGGTNMVASDRTASDGA